MSSHVRSAFEFQLDIGKKFVENNERSPDTPYTTFHHNDVWIKNFMTKRGMPFIICLMTMTVISC